MSAARRAGSRDEGQAHSSNAPRLKQVQSVAGAFNSPADPKPASSQVKAEAQPLDGINSPSMNQKPGDDPPIKVQLVNGKGEVPAGEDTASVQVKIQTEDTKCDARPEPGEISNAASGGGQKGDDVAVPNGTGLSVKLAVRVKGDEAVGGSPAAKPQEPRLRERYVCLVHKDCQCGQCIWASHAGLMSCYMSVIVLLCCRRDLKCPSATSHCCVCLVLAVDTMRRQEKQYVSLSLLLLCHSGCPPNTRYPLHPESLRDPA